MQIQFKNLEEIGKYINIVSSDRYKGVDINLSSDRYLIDGKSILGAMTLGCGKILNTEILTDNAELKFVFETDMKVFEV